MTATWAKVTSVYRPALNSTGSVETILLALDEQASCRTAVPVACTLSEICGATLHVTYVGQQALDPREAPGRLGFTAQQRHGAVFNLTKGDPAQVVAQLARELAEPLIVMSTHTGPPGAKDRFGSITESVLATRPERIVLLAPERRQQEWKLRRVLLAHDGTPTSHAATAPAARLAQRAGAEIIALHVAARGRERPREPGSMPAPLYIDQPQHEWPAWAEEFMNRILAAGAPPSAIEFKLAVTSGRPGSEIAELARERAVDLVVMAWHGHWEHQTCATRVVIQTSGCPVLLLYSADE
jgi:nucleotide-binding universal stress UspA family protein